MPLFSQYAQLSPQETALRFTADLDRGLSSREARDRVRRHGQNELAVHPTSHAVLLARQFKSPFIYLLCTAAAIAFTLGERIDAVLIVVFVLVNAGIGFYQEFKSSRTLQLLRQFVIRRSRVKRDGVEAIIPSREIVPGDIVIIEAGDVTPADLRLIEANDVMIDESALTGESAPVEKRVEALPSPAAEIYSAYNIAFSGTTVITGKGVGIAIACGLQTVIGDISRLATETPHVSVFAKGLQRFSIVIMRLVVVTLVCIVAANIFIKGGAIDIPDLLIFAIALAVSVIPEALPVVTTFSLARGALRLARHHVVVKRLASIEDLGSIDILCTDKTGTLTENTLAIADTYVVGQHDVIATANLGADPVTAGSRTANNAFDGALAAKISETARRELAQVRRHAELPFDPVRRRNSVLVEEKGHTRLIVRGAPETLFPLCTSRAQEIAHATAWVQRAGARGFRVIAVCEKKFDAHSTPKHLSDHDERGLTLIGCIAFSDPLKKTAMSAVAKARKLNVGVKILTGDSKEVAGYIGQQIGLIQHPTDAMTGEELEELPQEERYAAAFACNVFARVSPQQKHAIIQLLQRSHEVGFLGEGINDAPALKSANVGLVVAGASDIAQETADIVLLKKSLDVVIDGIHEGREVFVNTIKYIKATLASNFGNFYAVAIASLFIDFLPMLPIQILLVNLLSDFPMIAIAVDTTDAAELKQPKHYDIKEVVLIASVLGLVSTVFDFILFAMFYERGAAVLQTNWFIGSIVTELAFLFSVRTRMPFFKARRPAAILAFLSLGALLVTLALPFIGGLRSFFHFTPPHASDLVVIAIIVITYFCVTEVVKHLYYHFIGAAGHAPGATSKTKVVHHHPVRTS